MRLISRARAIEVSATPSEAGDGLFDRAGSEQAITPGAQRIVGFKRDASGIASDGQADIQDYFRSERPASSSAPTAPPVSADAAALQALTQYAQAGAPPAAAAATQVIGTVNKVTGTVVIVRFGVSIQLNVGDQIRKGDIIQTESGSAVAIILIDGTALNLGAGTRMAMHEFTYDANSTANSSLLNFIQGSFAFVAGQVATTGGLNIQTPVATMGIRGTVGGGACDGGGCEFHASLNVNGQPSNYTLLSGGTFVNGQYVGGTVIGTVTVGTNALVGPSALGQIPPVTFIAAASANHLSSR